MILLHYFLNLGVYQVEIKIFILQRKYAKNIEQV